MATVEEGLQAQIRNIEATFGKPIREWLAVIAASGRTKHTDIVNMLKNDHGMTHGAAPPGVTGRPARSPVRVRTGRTEMARF